MLEHMQGRLFLQDFRRRQIPGGGLILRGVSETGGSACDAAVRGSWD